MLKDIFLKIIDENELEYEVITHICFSLLAMRDLTAVPFENELMLLLSLIDP